MKLSKTSLLDEAAATGFRPDTLEKVIRLLDLLTQINQDDFLKDRLVLKGGSNSKWLIHVPPMARSLDTFGALRRNTRDALSQNVIRLQPVRGNRRRKSP